MGSTRQKPDKTTPWGQNSKICYFHNSGSVEEMKTGGSMKKDLR